MLKTKKLFLAMAVIMLFGSCQNSSEPEKRTDPTKVYKDLEKALKTGDGKLWLELQSKELLENLDQAYKERVIEKGIPANPGIRKELMKVMLHTDKSAVFGKSTGENGEVNYEAMVLLKEDGSWKLTGIQLNSDKPIHPYSFFPPGNGLFMDSNSPWRQIEYAAPHDAPTGSNAPGWKMKGVQDGSFLYIRLENNKVLPKPGTKVDDPAKRTAPGMPPALFCTVSSEKGEEKFRITVGEGITSKAKFGKDGRAIHNMYKLNYTLSLYGPDSDFIFQSSTSADRALIQVSGKAIDLRIPKGSLGLEGANDVEVTLTSKDYFEQYKVKTF